MKSEINPVRILPRPLKQQWEDLKRRGQPTIAEIDALTSQITPGQSFEYWYLEMRAVYHQLTNQGA